MTETTQPAGDAARDRYLVELTAEEARLLRTALKLLIATLTREEADELEAAQALLDKLPDDRS